MSKKNLKRKIIKLFRHPVQVFRNRIKKLLKKQNNESAKPKIQNIQNIKENIVLYTITGEIEKEHNKEKLFLYLKSRANTLELSLYEVSLEVLSYRYK